MPKTDGLTHFKPGQSGNPGGRPKGLARKVRELVGNDGQMLADFHIAIVTLDEERLELVNVKARDVSVRDRQASVQWLTERGWGKAPTFAPVEEGDPLELDIAESAIGRIVDELASRREKTVAGPVADGAVAADSSGGAASTGR